MTEAKQPKPPAQLRITRKQQFDHVYNEDGSYQGKVETVPLGFAIAYKPTLSTFAKQMTGQDNWAYKAEYGHNLPIVKDGQYYIVNSKWEPKNGMTRTEAQAVGNGDGFELIVEEILAPYQPIIVDNVPMEGFRIQHMVARTRGNKLWRILDPRGFELEIGSGTFEDLVMTGMVDSGLIIGPCIWQTGKMLVRV